MASKARYTFDLDFQAPPPPAEVKAPAETPAEPEIPKIDLVKHLVEMGEAETRGRAQGFEAGRASAEARAAERLAEEAARLTNACRAMIATLDADRLAVEKEAIDLALSVARKLAGRLIDAEPLGEIRALMAECLGPLRKAPHLVLRIAAVDADEIRPHVDRMTRETGFEGRLVILGEPDMARGDCRIEWADGGIVRDSLAIEQDVDAAIGRYLEARQAAVQTIAHADPSAGAGQRAPTTQVTGRG